MLILRKIDRQEARLELDEGGAKALLAALRSLREGAEVSSFSDVQVDSSLLGRRGRSALNCRLRFALQSQGGAEGSLEYDDGDLLWRLVGEEGEVEYAMRRISDSLDRGEFSPAEFLMIQTPRSNHLTTVFGVFLR